MAIIWIGNQPQTIFSSTVAGGFENWLTNYICIDIQAFGTTVFSGISYKSVYIEGTAQILLPDSDITVGSWKNESSGSVLYPSLEDNSDSTYAWYNHAVVNDYFEVSLDNPPSTPSATAHTILWRAYKKAGIQTVTLKCELRQGASTVIASDTQTMTTSVVEFHKALTSGEISNISNYNDLRIRVTIMSVT
jgi:hypothetical protein